VISRRAFLAASIAATFSPFVEAAPPPTKTWRIGYLGPVSPSAGARLLESFRQGLRELGYVEGHNISIDYRWAEGRLDRFPVLAAELAQLKVNVIVTYNNAGVTALQRANENDTDRLCQRGGSGRQRFRRYARPAGWKHHWVRQPQ
jgi:putative ABC transport system substrate-binding protein